MAWYVQAARGQWDILSRRQPLEAVIADPETRPGLVEQLSYLSQARDFASQQLALPDNDSYRSFAALEREAAVWTLVVTPALSLEPHQWCYPLVGCQSYRGYFNPNSAQAAAADWRQQGYDSLVLATPAYSTLGWFDDPILDTMLRRHDEETAGAIFHELAHQLVFVKGDTGFNESYASWVERGGVADWLNWRESQGWDTKDIASAWENRTQWRQNYYYMLQMTRDELARLYRSELAADQQQQQKQQLLEELRQRLTQAGLPVPEPLNNAQLAIIATYEDGVGRFARLFQCHNNEWPSFHAAVRTIAAWPAPRRSDWLAGVIDTPPELCQLTRASETDKDKP